MYAIGGPFFGRHKGRAGKRSPDTDGFQLLFAF